MYRSLISGGQLQTCCEEIWWWPSALQWSHGLSAGTCQDRKKLRGSTNCLVQEVETAHWKRSAFMLHQVLRPSSLWSVFSAWSRSFLLLLGPQYGSVERAWLAVMTEAEKVSELHQDVKNNLLNDDVEKVRNWQKEAYHKQMIGGFKEAKEAEEGFKKAQKPWAKKLKEVREPSLTSHTVMAPQLSLAWCHVQY